MHIENENLFRSSLLNGINFFVGAGFSLLAKDNSGKNLVLGSDLAIELCEKFSIPTNPQLGLPQICTIIEFTRKNELRKYLTDRHTVSNFDTRYSILDKLNIKNIFTTNIDDLL